MASSSRPHPESYYYSFVTSRYNTPVTFDRDTKDSALVKSIIPYSRFQEEIALALKSDPDLAKTDATEMMVVKLLDYFKNDFFKWVDVLDCDTCGSKCRLFNHIAHPVEPEYVLYHADTVEVYFCEQCKTYSKFPRYNDPRKLLQTRKGRCGEWANCFAYILRCLDIPVRLVYCTTDHVWVEFYNRTEKRWIHADPCENDYDNPLLYQTGWGKYIDLVLARGEHEIRDVTWRYTSKWKATLEDRKRTFDERRLNELISQWNVTLQGRFDCKDRKELEQRWVEELVEFIRLPGQEEIRPNDKASQGRKSGSLAWRLSRTEIRTPGSTGESRGYAFKLRSDQSRIFIAYDCNQDHYMIEFYSRGELTLPDGDCNDYTEFRKWSTCVYRSENIFRNVELDWKMCYLARNKGSRPCDLGKLLWKFEEEDLNEESKWKRIEICIEGGVFFTGQVALKFYCGSYYRKPFPLGETFTVTREEVLKASDGAEDFKETGSFDIEAQISGGTGECAWQHSQLFRQSTNSNSSNETFRVTVYYE